MHGIIKISLIVGIVIALIITVYAFYADNDCSFKGIINKNLIEAPLLLLGIAFIVSVATGTILIIYISISLVSSKDRVPVKNVMYTNNRLDVTLSNDDILHIHKPESIKISDDKSSYVKYYSDEMNILGIKVDTSGLGNSHIYLNKDTYNEIYGDREFKLNNNGGIDVKTETKKAYVLFEESQTEKEISTKDVMGITFDKDYAIKWVDENSEYRRYKETSLIDDNKVK